jgi:hypothetical protein
MPEPRLKFYYHIQHIDLDKGSIENMQGEYTACCLEEILALLNKWNTPYMQGNLRHIWKYWLQYLLPLKGKHGS